MSTDVSGEGGLRATNSLNHLKWYAPMFLPQYLCAVNIELNPLE